jgi:CDP-glucose 4,6-dehydratase
MNPEFWKGKRVLITGHTGFKGSWLSFWLAEMGAEVCGYALEPEDSPNLFDQLHLDGRLSSVIGDIRDLDNFSRVVSGFAPDIVFHLAAQSLVRRSYRLPVETYSTNVMGTINVLESVRHSQSVKAAVIVTTDKVYENRESNEGYKEDERLGGFDPYSNSKACTELATSSYRSSFFADSQTLIATARAGNVIGGGDWSEDRLLPDVFRHLIFGKPLLIRNPNSVRPWQHVLEPLSGYLILAEALFNQNRELANSWNFGSEDRDARSVGEILNIVDKLWEGGLEWDAAPGSHPHETNILKLDSTRSKRLLGWEPRLALEEALGLTTEWYLAMSKAGDLAEITRRQIKFYQGSN